LPFVPRNSFEVVDDDGLGFWDQRTIYVEPHLRNICPAPARVAQWLTEHGQLKPKWLPIQAVHMLWNSCAFVMLSGNVMHNDTWSKWRETGKPDDWKVMTKVEHTKRTAEYLALLEQENPRGMRKTTQNTNQLPPIARPAALPIAFKPLPESVSIKVEGKKKRKRRKPTKSSDHTGHAGGKAEDQVNEQEADMPDARMADAPSDAQQEVVAASNNKKKRKRRKPGAHVETDDNTAAVEADEAPTKKQRR